MPTLWVAGDAVFGPSDAVSETIGKLYNLMHSHAFLCRNFSPYPDRP